MPVSGRYVDLGHLAAGGMGEVRRVRDTHLDREVVLKTVRTELAESVALFRRLRLEAEVTARLQHPGVVCVIDAGTLPDGRRDYTMPLVEGRTLSEVVAQAHADARGPETDPAALLQPLVSIYQRVCQTVAYAHSRNVLHRDLKPANVMVGRFGEVDVMDWGLAKVLEADDAPVDPSVGLPRSTTLTTYGHAMGTPGYMPPEQLRGEAERLGPHSDVCAPGGVLYALLTGVSLFDKTDAGAPFAPPAPVESIDAPLNFDPTLRALCGRAMAAAPEDRPAHAGLLADAVGAWLAGAERRARAEASLRAAEAHKADAIRLRGGAEVERHRAAEVARGLEAASPEAMKRPMWALEDQATSLERAAREAEANVEQHLRAALGQSPEHRGARTSLAAHYRDRMARAEARGDFDAAREAEVLLRANDPGDFATWLRGDARLSVSTLPEGARVTLRTWARVGRILALTEGVPLGLTPLVDVPVPSGSHSLTLTLEGYAPCSLPFRAGRLEAVQLGPADAPLPLLPVAALGPDDLYLPPGEYPIGGDPDATEPLPEQQVRLRGVIVRRYPVTVGEVLDWLNTLVDAGREAEALRHAPHLTPYAVGGRPEQVLRRSPSGHFELPASPDWLRRLPQVDVSWETALAYAEDLAKATGRPWRLLHEVEREVAARGADARVYPWGNHPEATWSRNALSDAQGPHPVPVDAPEALGRDEGPFGVRGLVGNVRDWCLNGWRTDVELDETGCLVIRRPDARDGEFRLLKGGAWSAPISSARAASRLVARPGERLGAVGFRVGFSLS
jgi:serine/threonine-protein kinase